MRTAAASMLTSPRLPHPCWQLGSCIARTLAQRPRIPQGKRSPHAQVLSGAHTRLQHHLAPSCPFTLPSPAHALQSEGDLAGDLAADLLLRQPLVGMAEDAASEAGAEDGPEQQEQQQKRVTLVASVVLSAWASSIKLFSTDLATEIREGVDDLRFLLKEAMEATQVRAPATRPVRTL
jgi:hypothetical protein